jgi:hypothetical protein
MTNHPGFPIIRPSPQILAVVLNDSPVFRYVANGDSEGLRCLFRQRLANLSDQTPQGSSPLGVSFQSFVMHIKLPTLIRGTRQSTAKFSPASTSLLKASALILMMSLQHNSCGPSGQQSTGKRMTSKIRIKSLDSPYHSKIMGINTLDSTVIVYRPTIHIVTINTKPLENGSTITIAPSQPATTPKQKVNVQKKRH